jgi:hypothetical protein
MTEKCLYTFKHQYCSDAVGLLTEILRPTSKDENYFRSISRDSGWGRRSIFAAAVYQVADFRGLFCLGVSVFILAAAHDTTGTLFP